MSNGISTMDLAGRRAIVTGGASGIGKATAVAMARLGAEVVVTDIDEAGGANVAAEIGGSFAMLDVGDPVAWARVVETAGPFDIAFLNAGITTRRGLPPADGLPLTTLTDGEYRRIMAVNVDGVVYGARAVLPGMIERGSGDIVATASLAGLVPIGTDPLYGLTKHAVVGFIRSAAQSIENNPDAPDVCLSAICPGFTDTSILSEDARTMLDELGIEVMHADDVAEVVTRSLHDRVQGAEWVIWPGLEPHVYEWKTPIPALQDDADVGQTP